MSNPNGDTRSPITDALETLGLIHWKKEARDAIHLAVEPVVAAYRLRPGQRIGIVNGVAYAEGTEIADPDQPFGNVVPYHGIVDPFLTHGPAAGESFWFVMKPREVRSLRHVWEHPDFPEGV